MSSDEVSQETPVDVPQTWVALSPDEVRDAASGQVWCKRCGEKDGVMRVREARPSVMVNAPHGYGGRYTPLVCRWCGRIILEGESE